MNAIFFGLKRAFHGTLRVARPMLTSLGLTAARFDLLYALMGSGRTFGKEQSRLRKKLGVSRPTVSRMLRSLEERGLVSRERSRRDRRQLEVRLTELGLGLIRRAHRILTESGWAQLAVDSALGATSMGNRWYDPMHCLMETDRLEGTLKRVRDAFGDFATLYYPWHPQD
jgi:MarR family transcriptional regulator, organic hydroperoxide resistance regulator